MILSTNTDPQLKHFSTEQSIGLIAEAGFNAYDMSYFDQKYASANHVKMSEELRHIADEIGIVCNQAHAPFPSSVGDASDKERFETIVRSMESAAILGAKVIVVHPKQHLSYIDHVDELREMNIEFYSSLVPYCKEFGIKVAVENMWQCSRMASTKIVESTCASPEEFCDYVDSIGSEYIVACLDIGHAILVGRRSSEMIHALGKNRLKALHVHDVDGVRDLHTLPYLSYVDFDDMTKALGEIDYDGDFTFESGNFNARMPKELQLDALKFECKVGRHLISLIEKNR